MTNDAGVAYDANRTLAMTVDNTGFMLDRMGKDCSPLQFLRELTQNAIEAIAETPEGRGEIVWDVDWNQWELSDDNDVYKLACIDTGGGMTGEQMLRYINMLSSSTREQSYEMNYGVGAKVAAATRNHAGLIYLSWKDGIGSMIHLWRDPDSGQYGLRQFPRGDGTFSHWRRVEDSVKPEQIKDHGTMVVLLGNDPDQNTMLAPKGVASPSRWVGRYLNTRYFTFPEGVVVKAREGWENPRSNTDSNLLRTITGQRAYLDTHSTSSGTVELENANAHWWILKDEKALTQNSGSFASSGHMAALYHDELYELVTGRAGTARLQLFGIIFGYNRVVVYVEPEHDRPEHDVVSNLARTQLLMDEEPLPWADWAAEFRDKMPQEIKELMEEVTAGSTSGDHKQSIKDRLKQIRDLFRISRFRRSRTGALSVAEETVGGPDRKDPDEESRKGSGKGRGGLGRAGGIYALFAVDEGEPGEEVFANIDPEVRWVSEKDGTRVSPFLDDRAAKYLPELNEILINADFRVITDMVDRWHGMYADAPGARSTIEDTVHEWFEQALMETVLGVQALNGSQEWNVEDIGRALSVEALTAAVMQRYHIDNSIKRVLGARLGSLKEKSA